MACDKYVS
jgi:hypothetical protein